MQPGKLSKAEIQKVREFHDRIGFYGTAEKSYRDSGLWEYLSYVKTKDSHDSICPVKRLPVREKKYLQAMFLFMLACPVLFIPKSRQIMVSWALAAFATWFARTSSHRNIVWQSKKEDDANDMVSRGAKSPAEGRMDFIEQHLGVTLYNEDGSERAPGASSLADPNIVSGTGNQVGKLTYHPKPKDTSGLAVRWYGSVIGAVPEGGDQVRSKTPSLTIPDEAAFQDNFEAAMTAILPAIRGSVDDIDGRGGKLLAASSVNQGYFIEGCLEGRTADGDGLDPAWSNIPPATLQGIMPTLPKGMKCRKTPSGLWVLEVHYSADPAKDPDTPEGRAWVAMQAQGYVGGTASTAWLREMEIDYEAKGGNPVFPFLNDVQSPIWTPPKSWQIFLKSHRIRRAAGYDFGSTNPSALVAIATDEQKNIYTEGEIYEPCDVVGEHCARLRAHPQFSQFESIWADQSMWWPTARDKHGRKTSYAELYAAEGVRLTAANRGVDATIARMIRSVHWSDIKNPSLFIDRELNPMLARELRGLRWKEYPSAATAARNNNPEEIVQKDNHAADALFYVLDKFNVGIYQKIISPPPGTYGYADMEHDRWLEERAGIREGIVCL